MKRVYMLAILIAIVLCACRVIPQTYFKYEHFTLTIERVNPPIYKLTNTTAHTIEVEMFSFTKPFLREGYWERIFVMTIPAGYTSVIGNIGYRPELLFKTAVGNTITYDGYKVQF